MNTLLITGAINIEHNLPVRSKLIDTEQRLNQYLNSIIYAIQNYKCVTNIVFCENTGYNYDYKEIYLIAKTNNKNFEALTFKGNFKNLIEKGKGYGEGEIIEYCLKNSLLLNDSSSFIKLTGRLLVNNFDKLFKNFTNENIFILDNVPLNKSRLQISTILYKVNIEFYKKYFILSYLHVDDNNEYYLEHAFGKSIKIDQVSNFRKLPDIIGTKGSSGFQYKNSLRKKVYFYFGLLNIKKNIFSKAMTILYCNLKRINIFLKISQINFY